MRDKVLVIVESPTKAKTIRKFLPDDYIVEACVGHIRDLPQSASDIPQKYKKEEWAKIGINTEEDFAPLYIIPKDKKKIVRELKAKAKEASEIYLATDEDREGESISWHLVETLKPKVPVKRMVFHEITRTAITKALDNCREIDNDLVQAQETRRILDRLFGYNLSPLIWKKIAYGLSAGRVQSPGLRLIVEKERERIAFEKAEFFDIKAEVLPENQETSFEAKLRQIDGKRIITGKDFDSVTGKAIHRPDTYALTRKEAEELTPQLKEMTWKVEGIEEKESRQNPGAPYITSTLQQDANKKLGLSARNAMRSAQRLYEMGLITYMRTDSPYLSNQALDASRKQIAEKFGSDYLPESARQFASKDKSAQEAHEAIRPSGSSFKTPEETGLTGPELALYRMIWQRTLASQMKPAVKSSMQIDMEAGRCLFRASGTRIVFPGFLAVYQTTQKETLLPALSKGASINPLTVEAQGHETRPPARYTEASLIQKLEELGIGRPSTYASIISTLYQREYIRRVDKALVPTFTGFAVIQLLEEHFGNFISNQFTSEMENALDRIAIGSEDKLQYLKDFYFSKKGLKPRVEDQETKIDPAASRSIHLKQIEPIDIKIGRFGPYISFKDDEGTAIRASIPEELSPADITREDLNQIIEHQKKGPTPLGKDPETGEPIYCLIGRFGPYVQLGEATDENPKPKRASLPRGYKPDDVTEALALRLLSLPRTLGNHPESGKEIIANNGRFGPYVSYDGEFRSLKKEDDVYTITLERGLELLAEEKKSRASVVRDLGKDPKGKNGITVRKGRYGLYLKKGTSNFELPKQYHEEKAMEALTYDQAAEIIKEKQKKKKAKK